MSIRSALRTYLTAQAGVTDLVSERIYGVRLPESATLPAITWRRATGAHRHNLGAASGEAMPTFELIAWAESYDDADAIAEAIRQVMQGFRGAMGSVAVTSVTLDDESDEAFEPEDGSDEAIFAITLSYRIQYRETIPTF